MDRTAEPILLIVDPEGRDEPEFCWGPDAGGACPQAVAGRPVPCAGKQLVAAHGSLPLIESRRVLAGTEECPLAVLLAGIG